MGARSKLTEVTPEAGIVPENRMLQITKRVLPWLLGALMLGVFGWTLNPWVSPDSMGVMANLEGLTWTPHLFTPVTSLLLRPISFLPAGDIPLAVNILTAMCAAASLGFLARSVALLPHDLSKEAPPSRRGFVPPALLASRMAWLPPLFAVLACGLQLSFWQNAISATGAMVNLLMFSYVIRCFLEYNASGRDSWLLRAALVYGLALANDWALGLFIPPLLVGLVWVKRLYGVRQRQLEQMLERRGSFKLALLWQIPACWLAGFSLVLLPPLLAAFSATRHMDFWMAMTITLESYWGLLHMPRQFVITSSLISVMPVFLIGLRYYHFQNAANRLHLLLGTAFLQLVLAFFLVVSLWTLFDTPLSPRRQAPSMDTLPFYWLEALSIGYFIGHFLLTAESPDSSSDRERRRSSSSEQRRQRQFLTSRVLKMALLIGVIILAVGLPAALVRKNLREITSTRSNPFTDFCQQLAQPLPPSGAVVIGSDPNELAYLQMELIRHSTQAHYLLLNTAALEETTNYWPFLQSQKHPGFDLNIPLPNLTNVTSRALVPVTVMEALAKSHAIYCLPPAPFSDYLAELFYAEPHGLIYRLAHYNTDEAFAPATPAAILEEEKTFWQHFRAGPDASLVRRINPPVRVPASGWVKRFVNTLRYWPEVDLNSAIAGHYYAIALNDWGVVLQREGQLSAAGDCFTNALQLDSHNAAAGINQEFNAAYQANQQITLQKPLETALGVDKYRDWRHVVTDGAVDEPNFCYLLGAIMADNHLYRPAIAQFERVKQLSPASLDTSLSLTRLFAECHDVTNTLNAANEVLAISPANETGLFFKANSDIRLENYPEAITLLNQVITEDPTNILALLNRAIANRKSYLFSEARRDYAAVIQAYPASFPAYYDLAQLDDAESSTAAAITNYEMFLKYAPANEREIPEVKARLQELEPGSPSLNSSATAPVK